MDFHNILITILVQWQTVNCADRETVTLPYRPTL